MNAMAKPVRLQTLRAADLAALAVLVVSLTGCGDEQIDTTYGRRVGLYGGESVNGTAVLAGMFEQAGHRVLTKRVLTDAMMENCDVIVWAPDDFEPPAEEVIRWFDEWLWTDGRTLIFIGRDFDAAPDYYDKVIPMAPPEQANELRTRRANAMSDFTIRRSSTPAQQDSTWYATDRTIAPRTVSQLQGRWSEGIDPEAVEIPLRSRLTPKVYYGTYDEYDYYDMDLAEEAARDAEEWEKRFEDDETEAWEIQIDGDPWERAAAKAADEGVLLEVDADEVLLRSGDDILISRQPYDEVTDSHIIIVANGSTLLNLPLVNHQHRKLASRLVAQWDEPRQVVFLESGPGGPDVLDEEPSQDIPTGLALFSERPLDVILFHLAVVGLVFCLSRWPLFGRPRQPPPADTSDFGKHVDALGQLLQRAGDREFAASRYRQFEQSHSTESSQLVRPTSGAKPDLRPGPG